MGAGIFRSARDVDVLVLQIRPPADRGSHRGGHARADDNQRKNPKFQVVEWVPQALVPYMVRQWEAVLPNVFPDRIHQQTVVDTGGMPVPRDVEGGTLGTTHG